MKKNTTESVIASSIGKLLRENFGKGPETLYVTIAKPFITVYLGNFLAPIEKVLLQQKNDIKVQETRDLLMKELIPEVKTILSSQTGKMIDKLYYDWSLGNKSGMLFAELKSNEDETDEDYLDYPAKVKVHEEIERFTRKAEKSPSKLRSFMVNSRTLVSRREDILVRIEQELIQSGFEGQLRLSKRRLEKSLIDIDFLEAELDRKIQDVFVDWDFTHDTGFVIFILS